MKVILTYGTFDVLHYGHINLLRRAKELGDKLIVVCSSDEFNSLKNKKSLYSYEERKLMLESIKYVDLVLKEDNWEQKRKDIIENDVDIFVMGSDWYGKFDDLSDICEIVILERTEFVSSNTTRDHINNRKILNNQQVKV